MTPHTDPGALLKLADDLEWIAASSVPGEHKTLYEAAVAIRQAAAVSQPEVRSDGLLDTIDAIISDNVYVDNDGVAGISSAAEAVLAAIQHPAQQSADIGGALRALEQIAIVCTKNMDRDCNHRMALDGVRQIANDFLNCFVSPGAAQEPPMRDVLSDLEEACQRLAAKRPQAAYDAMIDAGQQDDLLALDQARTAARTALAVPQPAAAQASLPPPVDREELVALLIDLASVNLSHEACERQAKRMADDLIARGLSVPSAHRECSYPKCECGDGVQVCPEASK